MPFLIQMKKSAPRVIEVRKHVSARRLKEKSQPTKEESLKRILAQDFKEVGNFHMVINFKK